VKRAKNKVKNRNVRMASRPFQHRGHGMISTEDRVEPLDGDCKSLI